MNSAVFIETPRLRLRGWRSTDRTPYALMMADPEVGGWLGGTLIRAQADAQVDRFMATRTDEEPGFLAVERRDNRALIGATCLRRVAESHPMADFMEIGWRLARSAWGAGYATEAARALLNHGFRALALREVIAFTAESNLRSRAVMDRLGMARQPDRDFLHPALAPDHPLRPHVVYAATAAR